MIATLDELKTEIENLMADEFSECRADVTKEVELDKSGLGIRVLMRRGQSIYVQPGEHSKGKFLYTFLKQTHGEIGRLTVLAKHIDFLLRHEKD